MAHPESGNIAVLAKKPPWIWHGKSYLVTS
jgi:hypothetical protein